MLAEQYLFLCKKALHSKWSVSKKNIDKVQRKPYVKYLLNESSWIYASSYADHYEKGFLIGLMRKYLKISGSCIEFCGPLLRKFN